jgi:hypothetical protein
MIEKSYFGIDTIPRIKPIGIHKGIYFFWQKFLLTLAKTEKNTKLVGQKIKDFSAIKKCHLIKLKFFKTNPIQNLTGFLPIQNGRV